MKKIFKLFAFAVIAMGLTTACGNSNNTDENTDSTLDTMTVEEASIDTLLEVVAEDSVTVVDEQPAAKNTVAKKTEKKDEVKTLAAQKTQVSVNSNTSSTKEGPKKVDEKATKPTDLNNGSLPSPNTPKTKTGVKK